MTENTSLQVDRHRRRVIEAALLSDPETAWEFLTPARRGMRPWSICTGRPHGLGMGPGPSFG